MAMGIVRIFELAEEFKAEEANIKYIKRMHCDFGKVWYETIRVETPRYQELYNAIAQERIFPCRCCGEKVSYFGLADETENNYLCNACAPCPSCEFEDDEEFEV